MSGGLIEYQWMPQPVVIADEYRAIAFEFEHRQGVMHEALRVVTSDVENQFNAGGVPKWAPWAPATEADPRAQDLMIRSGNLIDGAISDGSYQVTSDFILWTGAAAPAYWRFHVFGTSRMPQRTWIGLTPEGEDEVVALFETWMESL